MDLWDTDWPQSGYYWTVIPVAAIGLGSSGHDDRRSRRAEGRHGGSGPSTSGFRIGNTVTIGASPTIDTETITGVGAGLIGFATPLDFAHAPGDTVSRVGGSVQYQDMELPQDACAAGRIQRFGISSEPSLTTAQEPFATGLSPNGRLTSAAGTPAFYGQPLVAWTPALGANIYEVQWSKTKYPFAPQVDPRTQSKGYMTFSTSAVLPARGGHLVLPRPRHRLQPADRCPANVDGPTRSRSSSRSRS